MAAEPRLSGNLRGVVWMIFGAVFFTLATVLIRVASVKFTIFEIVFYRVLIGSVIMLPWLFRAGFGVLRTSRLPLFALRAAFAYVAMLCFVFAVGHMPLAEMTALQFTLPLCITLAAVVVLRETVGFHRMVAPFDFLRLPMTAALAYVLFAEWPDGWTWIRAFIVFGAVTYSARRESLAS